MTVRWAMDRVPIVVSVLMGVVAWTSSASAIKLEEVEESLYDLLVEYRCPLVDRLARVYEAGDHASHRDRFVAVNVREHPHGYVQCLFFEHRTKVLCEASSGFYYSPPGGPRTFHLGRAEIAALGRLGFSTDDSKGNFRIELDVNAMSELNDIADLMLIALHDAYGARVHSELRVTAPFAPGQVSICIPLG